MQQKYVIGTKHLINWENEWTSSVPHQFFQGNYRILGMKSFGLRLCQLQQLYAQLCSPTALHFWTNKIFFSLFTFLAIEIERYLILSPTIIWRTPRSSSFEINSSLSVSYILKANLNLPSRELSLFSLSFLTGRKWANTFMNWRKFSWSSVADSQKNAFTILSPD